MSKKKYYVVWQGHQTGIFEDWKTCEQMVKNYQGARYKSFSTLAEATAAFRSESHHFIGKNAPQQPAKKLDPAAKNEIRWESISVDAACSGNPGVMEYRGVDTKTGVEIFRQGPFPQGTNNIGEFLALVHALALLQQKNSDMPIYSDSKTAMAWVRNKKIKTQLQPNARNAPLFDLMDRAVKWLEKNTYNNPILKWETESWGEIPADFGRKK